MLRTLAARGYLTTLVAAQSSLYGMYVSYLHLRRTASSAHFLFVFHSAENEKAVCLPILYIVYLLLLRSLLVGPAYGTCTSTCTFTCTYLYFPKKSRSLGSA